MAAGLRCPLLRITMPRYPSQPGLIRRFFVAVASSRCFFSQILLIRICVHRRNLRIPAFVTADVPLLERCRQKSSIQTARHRRLSSSVSPAPRSIAYRPPFLCLLVFFVAIPLHVYQSGPQAHRHGGCATARKMPPKLIHSNRTAPASFKQCFPTAPAQSHRTRIRNNLVPRLPQSALMSHASTTSNRVPNFQVISQFALCTLHLAFFIPNSDFRPPSKAPLAPLVRLFKPCKFPEDFSKESKMFKRRRFFSLG
jgi:hypothetical protein